MANLKGIQRPAAFAIVCFCFCEFRTVSYSGSCAEHVADFAQSMLVVVLPLTSIAFATDLDFITGNGEKLIKTRDRGAGGAGGALAPPIIFKR